MESLKSEIKLIKKRNDIIFKIEAFARENGFIKVESDFYEEYQSFLKLNARQDERRLIKIQDLRGNMFLLRPDVTTNIIKQVIPRMEEGLQLSLYYLDQVFSYSESGDINQTRQFGVEMIGDNDLSSDIKLIEFINQLFVMFDLKMTLEVGNQKWIETLINQLGISSKNKFELREAIIQKNKARVNDLLTDDSSAYQSLLKMVLESESDIDSYQQYIVNHQLDKKLLKGLEVIAQMKTQLSSVNVLFDLSLINPFDYYNGPIFKGYIKGVQKDILRGGRYDYLTEDYGKKTSALGFSLDLETLIEEVRNYG